MARDDGDLWERQTLRNGHAVGSRDAQVLGVASPCLHTKHLGVGAALGVASKAGKTGEATYALKHSYRIARLQAFDARPDLGHHATGVVAKHQRKGDAIVSAVLTHFHVKNAIDRHGTHLNQHLPCPRSRGRHLLPFHNFGSAELPDDHRFHENLQEESYFLAL